MASPYFSILNTFASVIAKISLFPCSGVEELEGKSKAKNALKLQPLPIYGQPEKRLYLKPIMAPMTRRIDRIASIEPGVDGNRSKEDEKLPTNVTVPGKNDIDRDRDVNMDTPDKFSGFNKPVEHESRIFGTFDCIRHTDKESHRNDSGVELSGEYLDEKGTIEALYRSNIMHGDEGPPVVPADFHTSDEDGENDEGTGHDESTSEGDGNPRHRESVSESLDHHDHPQHEFPDDSAAAAAAAAAAPALPLHSTSLLLSPTRQLPQQIIPTTNFDHQQRTPGPKNPTRKIQYQCLGVKPNIYYNKALKQFGPVLGGGCNAMVELRKGEAMRCQACGSRTLYKVRTKRIVQFEAR